MKIKKRAYRILKLLAKPIPEEPDDDDNMSISREEAAKLFKRISDAGIYCAAQELEHYLNWNVRSRGKIEIGEKQYLAYETKVRWFLHSEKTWEELGQWFNDSIIQKCCLFTKQSIREGLKRVGLGNQFEEVWKELEKSTAYRLTTQLVIRNIKYDNKRTRSDIQVTP